MFRKMPFILFFLMVIIGLAHPWIPILVKQGFYALSLSIKSLIVFFLPLIVFGLLFKTAVAFAGKASKMILFVLVGVCLSNFFSTLIAYLFGTFGYGFDLMMPFPSQADELQPAWNLFLPKWISNSYAMMAGLIFGIIMGRWKPGWAAYASKMVELIVGKILGGFLYLIPLFISGFVMKMFNDRIMGHLIQNYGFVFALIGSTVFAYIFLLYFLASRRSEKSFIECLKNMMPAAIAGFGTMSSAAAMPLTLLGTEKNASDPDVARSIIPATVNFHLIGDCFAIPIFAFAILKSFGIEEPVFLSYLIFAFFFVLAKFSVAAVPGGGILVMLPILEQYLKFDAQMLSLITALYLLFDPVVTCANVLGNGAFAMGLSRALGKKKVGRALPL